MRGCWSPQGCPQSSTTRGLKLQTDCPPAVTRGGSGSATAAFWGKRFYLNCLEFSVINKCAVFVHSLMEQRALPAYTPAILRLTKELPAITRITPTHRPSPSPGRPSYRVLTSTSGFFLSRVISSNSFTHYTRRQQMCLRHC